MKHNNWNNLYEAVNSILEPYKSSKYAYVAFAVEDEDSLFIVFESVGLQPRWEKQAQIRGVPEQAVALKWRDHIFGIMEKSGKKWSMEDDVSQISFVLGTLYHIHRVETMYDNGITTVFHDLRQPLTGILNTIDNMLSEPKLEAWLQDIRIIEDAASYMLTMSNDLLELHKLKKNQLQLHLASVEIRTFFQSIIDLMHENHVTIKLSIHVTVPEVLICDEIRVKQIFFNLITNSKKFGATLISIRCAFKESERVLYAEIEDDAAGIKKETLSTLFRCGGGGIGLLMCRKLLRLMQGNIFVKRTELGQGTTMAVYFTTSSSSSLSSSSSPQVPSPRRLIAVLPEVVVVPKILIADDNKSIRTTFKTMLHRLIPTATIDVAADGVEAVKMFEGHKYIFFDIRMPNMDGFTAASKIMALSSPYIFIISAYALSTAEKQKSKDLGLSGYLQKPFKSQDIIMLLERSGLRVHR